MQALCPRDCSCKATQYKAGSGYCYYKRDLFNDRVSPSNVGNLYVMYPMSLPIPRASTVEIHKVSCSFVQAKPKTDLYEKSDGKTKWAYFYWFLGGFGLPEFQFIACGWWFIFAREKKPTSLEEGYRLVSSQFKRFMYKELKGATENFKEELGRGGSGAVYKGVLDDKRVIAVKKLEDAIQGEDEFWAEVSVIGKIYHMNLLRMWGFCSDRLHKLLVYEHVINGSLNKHLFTRDSCMQWPVRFTIMAGVARALAYLHHEWIKWIVHCDVKPENILLDSEFAPKIADFGLVKFLKRGGVGSDMTQIHGTRGYMVPEWTSNLPITAKADVYSFGVVLVEVVMGSRVSDGELVSLVKRLKARFGDDGWVEEFVDGRLEGEFDRKQAGLMMKIAVDCLEEDRSRRPTM